MGDKTYIGHHLEKKAMLVVTGLMLVLQGMGDKTYVGHYMEKVLGDTRGKAAKALERERQRAERERDQ
jgi:hypothetical protein